MRRRALEIITRIADRAMALVRKMRRADCGANAAGGAVKLARWVTAVIARLRAIGRFAQTRVRLAVVVTLVGLGFGIVPAASAQADFGVTGVSGQTRT